jgi:hypothetical protein
MLPGLFENEHSFRQAFSRGLEELLQYEQLGSFILVLANAISDERLWTQLQPAISSRFGQLASQIRQALIDGRRPKQAPDDLLVFLKLMAVGLDNLQGIRFRKAGPWQLQYNQLRAFRPARMSDEIITDLHAPFDNNAFHFNKPFLRKEVIWEGELLGHHCRLLYNKFPFAPLHGILVMEPDERHPQYLGKFAHEYLWRLLEVLGGQLPHCGFGYNARGAGSSVNHQHVQTYAGKTDGYPIEESGWQHNGGDRPWPLPCSVFSSAEHAWHFIEELHRSNQAYNLLYRPGRLFVIQRAMQGQCQHADWATGFAWSEISGAITLFNGEDFASLSGDAIQTELEKLQE